MKTEKALLQKWVVLFCIFASPKAFILEYTLNGQLTGRSLNIPDVFSSACGNCGFEALTYNAVRHRFWTTTENTLKEDGDKPNIKRKIPNMLRLQSFDDQLQPVGQYWYMTDSSAVVDVKGKNTLGVSGLAALDNGLELISYAAHEPTALLRNKTRGDTALDIVLVKEVLDIKV